MKQMLCRNFDSQLVSRRETSKDTLRKVADWPVWTCQASEHTNDYDRAVSYYLKEGEATLSFYSGETLDVKPGDFVTIEEGASVRWDIFVPIAANYRYHDSFESADNRLKQVYWNRKI